MGTTIAEFFKDELVEWNRLIAFYNWELDEFENKLADVIQRNTIPNIAAKVYCEGTIADNKKSSQIFFLNYPVGLDFSKRHQIQRFFIFRQVKDLFYQAVRKSPYHHGSNFQ